MMAADAREPDLASPAVRLRAAVEYAIDGDLRFLSHQDEMRMLTRALVRSGWPLAYSRGFNPQPRLSIPLPRRTGTAAVRQLAIVELDAERTADELRERLAAALPVNVPLVDVICPLESGTPHARRAVFEIELDDGDAATLNERIATALDARSLPVQRNSGPGKPLRRLDIRPFIESLTWEGSRLTVALGFDGQLSARPAEVLTVLELDPGRYECRARRVEVTWDMPIALRQTRSGDNTRTNLGQEKDHA
jgi:radical SAM-linked protein